MEIAKKIVEQELSIRAQSPTQWSSCPKCGSTWYMGMEIAKKIVEQELSIRAESPTQWSSCPKCGSTFLSKGMRPRQIKTLVGIVGFSRRVGRCRNGCRGVQQAPLDQELGRSLGLSS